MDLSHVQWNEYHGQKRVLMAPATRGQFNELVHGTHSENVKNAGDANDPGYLVKYVDANDYISWTPADIALDTYRPNGALPLGVALEAVRSGRIAIRRRWFLDALAEAPTSLLNNKAGLPVDEAIAAVMKKLKVRWIAFQAGNHNLEADKFWNRHSREQATANGGFLGVNSYFIHYDGYAIQMGWLPSHAEMVADDFIIVDHIDFVNTASPIKAYVEGMVRSLWFSGKFDPESFEREYVNTWADAEQKK